MTAVTSTAAPVSDTRSGLPPLGRDLSFLGMLATQFLGAFNDNLFKQLVLLICVDHLRRTGNDFQGLAGATFALPFIFFSGFAGWLSDRFGKRGLVVLCKVAEIVIMGLGMVAFMLGGLNPEAQLYFLFAVLALMSTQSAYFGPAKYGILPELFRDRDLPSANGLIQMTTFLAIIFGMVLAGASKDWFGEELWIVSAMCVGIAVVGTITSLPIRKTPVAEPDLPLKPSSLIIDSSLWDTLLRDSKLLSVLLISSLFWLIGGLVPLAVNPFGKLQLGLSDTRTSIMSACMGVGIAAGCVVAGKLSKGLVRFGLVRVGSWGLIACFLTIGGLGLLGTAPLPPEQAAPAGQKAPARQEVPARQQAPADQEEPAAKVDNLADTKAIAPANPMQWAMYPLMILLGGFAGLFAVPLQVFLQHRPPRELKGRMIGAMNLVNWIGIAISAGIYGILAAFFQEDRHYSLIFAVAAAMLLPVGLFYRPKDEQLHEQVGEFRPAPPQSRGSESPSHIP